MAFHAAQAAATVLRSVWMRIREEVADSAEIPYDLLQCTRSHMQTPTVWSSFVYALDCCSWCRLGPVRHAQVQTASKQQWCCLSMRSFSWSVATLISLVNCFLPFLLMIHLLLEMFSLEPEKTDNQNPCSNFITTCWICLTLFPDANTDPPSPPHPSSLSLSLFILRLYATFHFRIKKPINPSPSWTMNKWISYIKMSKKPIFPALLPILPIILLHLFVLCVSRCVCVPVWTSTPLCGLPRFNGKPCLVSPTSLFDRPDEK